MALRDPETVTRRTSSWPRDLGQWLFLTGLTLFTTVLLNLLQFPAALLLGPMIAAIIVASTNGRLRLNGNIFLFAQSIVGCLMADSIPTTFWTEVAHDWPLFLMGVVSVISSSTLIGWLMMRTQVLPGTVGVWGSSPGAATAIILMAETFGADARLVALMQYVRVICVALVAAIVARVWAGGAEETATAVDWFPDILTVQFGQTMILALLGAFVAPKLRIPAGPLLVPLAVGACLQGTPILSIELPPWLLAVSYLIVGWSIGLRFTKAILLHAARALPTVLAGVLCLIGICGAFAFVLVKVAGVDPLTAYLATSPGGADSIAIIAASSKVDLPFVMAMQTARFIVVLLTGPAIARILIKLHHPN